MQIKKRIIFTAILVFICVVTPLLAVINGKSSEAEQSEIVLLNIWQIDNFEGGKGSRAQYLQNKANKLFKNTNCYVTVTTISNKAVNENIAKGNLPDMISYGAGYRGFESYINSTDFAYKTWCYGSYCYLTLGANASFDGIKAENTIINEGKENKIGIVTLFEGLTGANTSEANSAYLKLINGKYKYLLGTQRDVYRLKTRNIEFSVKAITSFNDIYQNISIITIDKARYELCKSYIDYLIENNYDVDSIGMMREGCYLYSDQMRQLEGKTYNYKINAIIGKDYNERLLNYLNNNDINLLKKLLK